MIFGGIRRAWQRFKAARIPTERLINQMVIGPNILALEAVATLQEKTNLYDGSLRGANLKGANLKGAQLTKANLEGAKLDQPLQARG